jgi:hypothetical protein
MSYRWSREGKPGKTRGSVRRAGSVLLFQDFRVLKWLAHRSSNVELNTDKGVLRECLTPETPPPGPDKG